MKAPSHGKRAEAQESKISTEQDWKEMRLECAWLPAGWNEHRYCDAEASSDGKPRVPVMRNTASGQEGSSPS